MVRRAIPNGLHHFLKKTTLVMAKLAMLTLWMSLVGAKLCMAQSNATAGNTNGAAMLAAGRRAQQPKVPLDATNWGPSVCGVRLLIYMTNSVVKSGSTANVLTVITNGSTNSISLGYTALPSDFDVLLSDGTKTLYHLTSPPLSLRINQRMVIDPGEEDARIIEVTFGEAFQPGDYSLQATRNFGSSEGGFKLESNPLKIQIK